MYLVHTVLFSISPYLRVDFLSSGHLSLIPASQLSEGPFSDLPNVYPGLFITNLSPARMSVN